MLKTKVHSAKVMDYEGIKTLLDGAKGLFPHLSHLWLDAGYSGEDKGGDWAEKTLGWTVEIVRRARKPAPKEVLMRWAKEGKEVDWQKLLPPRGFQVAAAAVGCREDVRLDLSQSKDEQGLRAASCYE